MYICTYIQAFLLHRSPAFNSFCTMISTLFWQVFLGQKYGYRPIPTHIEAEEFQMIRDCTKNEADELALMDTWYKCDSNTVPPVFILQPISSILTNFNNKVYLFVCCFTYIEVFPARSSGTHDTASYIYLL